MAPPNQALTKIKQRLQSERESLIREYEKALQATIFTNTSQIHPSMLKRVAADEAQTLAKFFEDSSRALAQERGAQLSQLGFSSESLTALGRTARQFCLSQLAPQHAAEALGQVDDYQSYVLQGFLQKRETEILFEQERIRQAQTSVLSRYTTNVQVASRIAQATTSLHDLNSLLQNSVELLRTNFDWYFVGIFLLDEFRQWAILRAATGAVGQTLLQQSFKLPMNGDTLVGWCAANARARFATGVLEQTRPLNPTLLPETRSEIVVPFILRGQVIGVLTAHSQRVSAFSDQDVTILEIVAGELTNAVENIQLLNNLQVALQDVQLARTQTLEETSPNAGFLYTQSADLFAPATDLWTDEMIEAVKQNQPVLKNSDNGDPTKTALAVPITLRNQVVGAIDLYDITEKRDWSENEIALANAVVGQTALALENAQLYASAQQALHETQTLYEMGLRMSTAQTLDQVLEAAAAPIMQNDNGRNDGLALLMRYEVDEQNQPKAVVIASAVGRTLGSRVPTGMPIPLQGSPYSRLIVANPNEPTFVEDSENDSRLDEQDLSMLKQAGVRSIAVIPLHIADRWLGILSYSWTAPHTFSDSEKRLYRSISAQAATVLDNRLLFQQTERALEETRQANQYLAALQETAVGLVSRLDSNELLRDIVVRAGDLVGTQNGYVYLVEPNGEEMQMRVGTGLYDDLVGATTRPGSGLAGLVWESGQPFSLDDYQKWEQRLPGARRDLLRAVVGVPLKSGDRTVGVIGLAYTDEQRKFGPSELEVLTRFASLASIALDNAQLYQETQRRVNELAILNRLSEALTSQLDVRALSELVVKQLEEIFPEPDAFVVSLYDQATNMIEIPYSVDRGEIQVVSPFPLGRGVASYIIKTREPLLINRDTPKRIEELGAITVGEPARSYLGVPILLGDQVIGTISVQSIKQEGIFDEDDVRLLSTIASTVGVALQNARLFEQTRRAQSFLDSLVENMPTLIWVKDAKELRYVSINKTFEDVLGLPREDLIGKNAFDMFQPDEAKRFESQDREVLQNMALLDVPEETVVSHTHGTRIIHTQKIPIVGPNNEPTYLLAIAEDITERKKADEERMAFERKLLETQKLESLGVLAGGIAHDFNNLLVSILGNVGLALLDLDPASPAREPVEQIKIAAQRAADLTKQMLAYSGKGRFVMQRINVNAIIEEMTQLLKVSISKSAVLRLNLTSSLPMIEADATQIRQVVMNLIVNASDAIGTKDGIITLSTGLVNADRTYLSDTFMAPDLGEGKYVYLEVGDTGVGMDLETQKKIFEPFFTTKFTGRGLGLAAVLGIVRGHKGAIKVYSEPGRGTTFRILLPSLEGSAHMDEGQKSGVSERGSGTILVIDDEDVVRSVTKRMLERFGYTVMMAPDGREGIDMYKANRDRVSLVLLDMTMPHMSGEETFRELRQFNTTVRVLLMSGYTEQEATSRFAGKGLAGFLQKPYTPQELHEKIQSILTDAE